MKKKAAGRRLQQQQRRSNSSIPLLRETGNVQIRLAYILVDDHFTHTHTQNGVREKEENPQISKVLPVTFFSFISSSSSPSFAQPNTGSPSVRSFLRYVLLLLLGGDGASGLFTTPLSGEEERGNRTIVRPKTNSYSPIGIGMLFFIIIIIL